MVMFGLCVDVAARKKLDLTETKCDLDSEIYVP